MVCVCVQTARKPLEVWAKEAGIDEPYEALLRHPKARKARPSNTAQCTLI